MTNPPTNLDSVTDEDDQRLLNAIGIELSRSDGPFTNIEASISINTGEYTMIVKGLQNIYEHTLSPAQWQVPYRDKPRVTTAKYSTKEGAVVVVVRSKSAYDAMRGMENRARSSGTDEDSRPAKRPRNQ